ncbi:MAG TPA: ABC transporter ATP-binding protein [Dongiaceae bacterium]|jgi:ATP-binding cassette subfamily B protein|nr:ABC transporter ATP-binding protein [Dongiaceae bacterium]
MNTNLAHLAQELRHRAQPFKNVLGFTFGHWRRNKPIAAATGICVLLSTMADVLVPVYAGRLIDAVAPDGGPAADRATALGVALHALIMMIGLGAAGVLFRHLGFYALVKLTLRVMSDAAQEAFARVQRFATDWHANTFAGSTVRKVTRGMWALDLLNDTLLIALMPAAVVLLGTTLLLGERWPLMGAVVLIGAVGFVALAALGSIGYVGPSARLSNLWDTRLGGALADAVSCNPVVKAFGAESREDARLEKVVAKWRKRTLRTWNRGTNNGSAQLVALLALRAAIIGMALWLWWNGKATPGDLVYVLTAYLVIHGYLRDVGWYIRDLQHAVNEMEEMVAIGGQAFGVADRPGAGPIAVTGGRIDFERVRFHYPGHAQPLYDDLDVTIRAGEQVGLVGLSGSGKTTFVKLIQRLHDIHGGRILIDGQDIAAHAQASLRSQIAIVQQEPILFHRSLAENIAYGRPGATMAAIEAAARLANAHAFIERLPSGYATLVGERGVKLSGGERQRVALARAFLADAPILILDEATSSLDSESEALIHEATERLIEGRTAIVIAHRLSTVRALKRILVFDRGRIIEEGDHRALIKRPDGVYRRLFDRQVLGLVEA